MQEGNEQRQGQAHVGSRQASITEYCVPGGRGSPPTGMRCAENRAGREPPHFFFPFFPFAAAAAGAALAAAAAPLPPAAASSWPSRKNPPNLDMSFCKNGTASGSQRMLLSNRTSGGQMRAYDKAQLSAESVGDDPVGRMCSAEPAPTSAPPHGRQQAGPSGVGRKGKARLHALIFQRQARRFACVDRVGGCVLQHAKEWCLSERSSSSDGGGGGAGGSCGSVDRACVS